TAASSRITAIRMMAIERSVRSWSGDRSGRAGRSTSGTEGPGRATASLAATGGPLWMLSGSLIAPLGHDHDRQAPGQFQVSGACRPRLSPAERPLGDGNGSGRKWPDSALERPEPGLEEPQVGGLEHHLEAPGRPPSLEHPRDRTGHPGEVPGGVDPPGNRQAHELEGRVTVLAGLRIPPRGDDPALHRPGPRVEVDLAGQALGRKLLLRDMRVDPLRVEEDSVAADRLDDRNAGRLQHLPELAHLQDARPDVIVVDRLLDADRDRLEIAPRQAAVRVEPLVHDAQVPGLRGEVRVVQPDPPPDVHQRVLLG